MILVDLVIAGYFLKSIIYHTWFIDRVHNGFIVLGLYFCSSDLKIPKGRMDMKMKSFSIFCLILLPVIALSACSGGGGGTVTGGSSGGATALVVTEKVSVVDAKSASPSPEWLGGAAVKPLLIGGFQLALDQLPADSDYNKDVTNVYVEERSTQNFNTVNQILCMIGQTQYDTMLNKGAYKALIDSNQCASNKSDASSAGQDAQDQSSGSSRPKYEMWTVESSRADNSSAEILKAWVHEEADHGEPAKVIFARVVITEGKSDSNPYGIFTLNFRGAPAADLTQTIFRGILKAERDSLTGKVLLKFVESGNHGSGPEGSEVTLDRAADGASGAGSLHASRTDNSGGTPVVREVSFDIAYDSSHFLRKDKTTNAEVCLNRNVFDESAWTYSLYSSTDGNRVIRHSGFSIKKDNAYGWMGYWGLWLPEGVTVNNGDTVNKHDYSTNTDTPYTVVKAGGKLKKHTRKLITLGDIKNIPLGWNECTGVGPCANYQVVWTGTAFNKIAQQSQSDFTWTSLNPVVPFDMSALNWGELNFYSESLSGQVRVKLNTDPLSTDPHCSYISGKFDCSAAGIVSNSTPVIFYAQDIVYPNDAVPATLACFDNCPNATAAGVDTSNPFFPFAQATANNYTFETATMLLKYQGNAVVQTAAIPNFDFGIMSGALFEPTSANLNLLKCDWDANQTCGWKAWSELPVFYSWETGLKDWNRFTALKDAGGSIVKFDPPLQVEYIHAQTNPSMPDYKYNGSKFYLQYSGFGNLQGIPGKCVNMDTGLEANCSSGGSNGSIQWVAAFTIPNGATATDGSNAYFVKALEKSQRMRQDAAGCGSLSASLSAYTLPTIADWVDPNIGDEPVLSTPPAVIGGIVQ